MARQTVYEFAWDPTKASSNLRDHGIAFDQAATVFSDPLALTVCDANSSQGRSGGSALALPRMASSWRWLTHISKPKLDEPKCGSSRLERRRGANDETMKKMRNRKSKSAVARPASKDIDMPAEIDFSGGTRGRFYRANARLNVPVYLDADVQSYLGAIAARKGMPLSELTNEILKKEIAILRAVSSDTSADQS
jgi:ribonuclease toxin BrnT of type II toxin-antitoxin system